jgi:DNA mismatch endonuclease (patch repair protein)
MQAIRSRGNRSTEWRLRATLVQHAIRGWNLHPRNVLGVPDFYFRSERLAVFVDGCFWHSCPRCGHMPKSNTEYWQKKITGNRKRDRRITKELRKTGYKVIRIWECQVGTSPGRCAERILMILHRDSQGPKRSHH